MSSDRLDRLAPARHEASGIVRPAGTATTGPPHVRDAIDLPGVMGHVLLALVPCLLIGLYNTGVQAGNAIAQTGAAALPSWRASQPAIVLGLACFLPVYGVTLLVGTLWQRVFAAARKRSSAAGFSVTALLFALSLPPTIPLWQVALGISFGLVIGREIFGGTGRNPFNPALTGLAFLYFAYPGSLATTGGADGLREAGIGWWQTAVGLEAGAPGETSALACLAGAGVLLYSRIISWRILAGGIAGLVATSTLFGLGAEPSASLPWYWHLTLGGFAFGLVFFATDPVTSAATDVGRWLYGAFIGIATVVIRVANPAHTEGVMLAILLANIVAPLIDHAVVRANVRRRQARGHG
ncbi:MAG: NADH:ubiquinone reductase (Na(+)-transporting) subunit B [Myxococcales bacterium]|nr:MAG: NADH:ubiquinone reductase (Na(+)-transporting) subunit B [Myxococcales bacterium]